MSAVDPYVRRKVGEAEVLLKQGGLVSAHFAIRKALRHDPDNVGALIVAAEIALRTQKRWTSSTACSS